MNDLCKYNSAKTDEFKIELNFNFKYFNRKLPNSNFEVYQQILI